MQVGPSAQYVIPMAGLLLGNSISAVSLGVSAVVAEAAENRGRIEQLLALGATRWEAGRPLLRRALVTAMTPVLNQMSVVGVVAIPGMMTGQILGGAAPELAARYQMVVLFGIAGTVCAAAVAACLLALSSVIDDNHCVRQDRVMERRSGSSGDIASRVAAILKALVGRFVGGINGIIGSRSSSGSGVQ